MDWRRLALGRGQTANGNYWVEAIAGTGKINPGRLSYWGKTQDWGVAS